MHQKTRLSVCVLALVIGGVVPAWAGLQDGLVTYFRLDETSGTTAADASGNGHDGTVYGQGVQWVPGRDGGGLSLATNVDEGGVQFPTTGMSVSAGTVSVWGYLNDPQAARTRYFFGHTTRPPYVNRIQIYMNSGVNTLSIGLGDTHARRADFLPLAVKTWHHIVLTWDNGKYVVYANGAQVDTGSYTGLTALDPVASFSDDDNPDEHESFDGVLDEARIYNRAITAAEVKAIYQLLPTSRILAKEPSPADKAVDVPADSVLSWTKSEFAATHDVYLGKTFADVNDASRTKPGSVLVSQGQTETAYTPAAPLEYGRTYYWRIDEANAAPDNTIFKGNVWSFTVEPYSYPIAGVAATASSAQNGMGPENTINGSGMTGDQHGNDPMTMWLSKGTLPNWIQYQFDAVYKVDKLLVWNSNQQVETFVGFGAKDVTVEYSVDGTAWTTLADVPQFAQGTGLPGYTANTAVNFGGVSAKYVKLTINKTWGGLTTTGFAEVRFFSVPVQAHGPQPAAGAAGVSLSTSLNWRPGREATSHQVFFGTDQAAVTNGTAPAKTVTAHTFDPGTLAYGTSYYWRVDEIGGAGPYAGPLWSFATQEFAVIDDFESYDDKDNRIYDTWLDGIADSKNGGSIVGYMNAPFAERTIVHGGKQAMPMEYNNVKTPYYSEATQTFEPTQNWTTSGADTLSLWFRGRAPGFLDNGDGTFTMSSSGTDIWNNGDQFRFAYKQLTGDGSMVARVDSVVNTNAWAKAGVMIRQSTDPGSTHAFMPITPGGSSAGNGASFQRRLLAAGASTNDDKAAPAIAPPYWVKIERKGNSFTGSISPDGKTWTQLGTAQTIVMTNPVLIGLAVCSHDATLTTTAGFSTVSTTGSVTGSWQSVAIGMAMPANTAAPLYCVVEDKAGKSKMVVNTNPSAAVATTWTQWQIPLSDLTGVNLTAVKKLTVGIGDKTSPKAGAAGMVYFDDIGCGHPVK